ncbi:CD2 antigen cytoplasmic tail-binding protein, partial [Trifolium medium]|nr:CD2 antigen cytoplasmic tail-binding protein [Trifolium medium]
TFFFFMSGGSSSRTTDKRPLHEDGDNFTKYPPTKRVRFSKGKEGKPVDVIVEKVIIVEKNVNDLSNPVVDAKERMKRRNQITAELLSDISAAEVKYEENKNFIEDGIHI